MELTARVARTRAATLSHVFLDGDDAPANSTTPVTVSVTDANGTVVTSGDATAPGDPGLYTFALPPQAQLALLTVAWSATIDGALVVESDAVEIVSGFFFTIPEIRASDATLADVGKYPNAVLVAARLETEVECEDICQRAFLPRYWRETLDGTGTSDVLLGKPDVRVIRSASLAPRTGQAFVPLTTPELAALAVTPDGMLRRTDANFWTEGLANLVLEYEFGLGGPPQPLREAALVRLRSLANKHRSGIPDRASSFTSVDGGTYRLTLPNRGSTGIPEVDAVYQRYGRGAGGSGTGAGGGAAPASRQLNYDPQYLSLYHGGPR